MIDAFRTPDERFGRVSDFDFEPAYRVVDGLRLAHVDVGEGRPVVMLHGSPAWSLIWRRVIPPLRDAGYRCIAPDHAGYGRSDKPRDPGWYSLDRHVELTGSLLEELDLRDVTLVVHDWGGPIGLRIALEQPARVARIVLLDTAIDHREPWMNDAWIRLRDFITETEDLPIGSLIRALCTRDIADDVVAAYEAPFPAPESMAALTGMMLSVAAPDDPQAAAVAESFADAVRHDPRPMLILWAESDLFLTLASGERLAARIGRRIDHVIPDAGHALQEDQGPLIGRLVAEWLGREPQP